jgi:hypothetical protein
MIFFIPASYLFATATDTDTDTKDIIISLSFFSFGLICLYITNNKNNPQIIKFIRKIL